ncbi:MAG TPA: hypothetical protein VG966_12245 [Hyphomicrobiaceae bacterium]|nr:hypothetical protein [Hyphomicrobiaceae bacterium]
MLGATAIPTEAGPKKSQRERAPQPEVQREIDPYAKKEQGKEDDAITRLLQSDATLQSLKQQIDAATAIATAHPSEQTLRNRQMVNESLRDLNRQFADRVSELTKGNLPFDKAHPLLAQWWPAIQWGGPVAAAMLIRGGANMADRAMTAPWRRAVMASEKALASGKDDAAAFQAGKASKFLEQHEPSSAAGKALRSAWKPIKDVALPTLTGAAVGMETSLYPHQHSRLNAPIGSPERDEAEKRLSPEQFWSTAAPGLMAGTLGGFTGGHLPNVSRGYRPIAETKNLRERVLGSAPKTAESSRLSPEPEGGTLLRGPESRSSTPETPNLQNQSPNKVGPEIAEPAQGPAPITQGTPQGSSANSPERSSPTPMVIMQTKDKFGRIHHRHPRGSKQRRKFITRPDKLKLARRMSPRLPTAELSAALCGSRDGLAGRWFRTRKWA